MNLKQICHEITKIVKNKNYRDYIFCKNKLKIGQLIAITIHKR